MERYEGSLLSRGLGRLRIGHVDLDVHHGAPRVLRIID
jgi:hypothetical protein